MKVLAALVSSFAFAASVCSQTTWNVGPGGYAQIRDIMGGVQDGDTVVVAPGFYMQFLCSKAITLRAATPGTVYVGYFPFVLPPPCGCTCLMSQYAGPTRIDVPVGKTAHCVGIEFAGQHTMAPCAITLNYWTEVTGRVTFDQCHLDHLVATQAHVHLQDCTVTSAYGAGIEANASYVTVVGGTINGSSLGPAPAILQNGGIVQVSGATLTGGAPSAPGIQSFGGSLVLVDSTVTAAAGCAVSATGLVRIDRCTLNGGGVGCAVSPTGAPLLGIDRSGPITLGQVFQVAVASEPNALVLVYGSTRLADALLVPVIEQPFWLDLTGLFLSELVIASTGSTVLSFPVPAVPVLVGAQFWLQGVGGTSFPMQTTPVVGGIVR